MSVGSEARALEARWRELMDGKFELFLGDRLVAILAASIPAGPHEGALKELLRAAFERGAEHGKAAVLLGVVEGALKPR